MQKEPFLKQNPLKRRPPPTPPVPHCLEIPSHATETGLNQKERAMRDARVSFQFKHGFTATVNGVLDGGPNVACRF